MIIITFASIEEDLISIDVPTNKTGVVLEFICNDQIDVKILSCYFVIQSSHLSVVNDIIISKIQSKFN